MDDRTKQAKEMVSGEQIAVWRDVLRCFPFDPAGTSLECVPHAQGFSGATLVRITARDPATAPLVPDRAPAMYCLRGWPPSGGMPRRRLKQLHRFAGFLYDQGVTVVPVPIADLRGESLVSVNGRFWQIEPWMPGVADFDRFPSDARLKSAMNVLARLHLAAARYEPTDVGEEWFAGPRFASSPAVGERLTLFESWTDARLRHAAGSMAADPDPQFGRHGATIIECFQRTGAEVHADLLAVSHCPLPLQVCLRDVWHDHLLFTNDELTGLVDLSAARMESITADLSRLLGSLLGKWSQRWDDALRWYGQVRPVTEHERRLVRILHRSGALLSGMTWIQRRIRGEILEETMPRIVERLASILRQLD